MKICILNVGHYRTGTTTLAKAAELVGYKVHRAHFTDLGPAFHKLLLTDPTAAVWQWWTQGNGRSELEGLINNYDFVADGFIPWLLMLPGPTFATFCQEMQSQGITVRLIATHRSLERLTTSELHHWVLYDLEAKAGLNEMERCTLEDLLRTRARTHSMVLKRHSVLMLKLEEIATWPGKLKTLCGTRSDKIVGSMSWAEALHQAGQQNSSPPLPCEGVLLTMRVDPDPTSTMQKVDRLLCDLTRDKLCKMIVVLALDEDEANNAAAAELVTAIRKHCPVFQITNPSTDPLSPFPICRIWDTMATTAFINGCDWVVLLGDDISVKCHFHFRAFYRSFLDISKRLNCPFGFGCPWWNDEGFSGFPTFPVVGKIHYEIFGSLIPSHRADSFVNQDLDPYIQRMYLKFGAAPLLEAARLQNGTGGNNIYPTRYERVAAEGWRDWLLDDVYTVKRYLEKYTAFECVLLDVVIPTYRLDLSYLERLCCLTVPDHVRTTFLIVVDNPLKLKAMYDTNDSAAAALLLEKHLAGVSANNIGVRCNAANSGASATRNRGLDESAAEYVLMLDDDVIPASDLLFQYEKTLRDLDASVVGLVGMVQFPRRRNLPIMHAAILMSYLTFMFEIAANELYESPAWGVTANLLVKRTKVRFDTVYAKTGGGEDVDFCLRLTQETGGIFLSAPQAPVTHDYWPGGLQTILPHFFKWAIGDSALFSRYPEHCFRSWPNAAEFGSLLVVLSLLLVWLRVIPWFMLPLQLLGLYLVDVGLELLNRREFQHRCSVVQHKFRLRYFVAAHLLANVYVIILELGRLYGHASRGELLFNFGKRFDWHCGRLSRTRERVVRRDAIKFVGFVLVIVLTSMSIW